MERWKKQKKNYDLLTAVEWVCLGGEEEEDQHPLIRLLNLLFQQKLIRIRKEDIRAGFRDSNHAGVRKRGIRNVCAT